MSHSLNVIRSLLFYIGFAAIIVLFGLLTTLLGICQLPARPLQEIATWGNKLIFIWLRICCGVRTEIVGLENMPSTPAVFLSNHESTWETFYLQRLFRPVSTILKRELLRVPFFGWGLYFMRPIPIDRSNPKAALRKVQLGGVQRLGEGNHVLVFPEGTRHKPSVGKHNYARSGAAIAIEAGAPIIPVVHNGSHCWPFDSFVKKPGTVTLIIGEAIETKGAKSRELTKQVQSWIETQRSQLPG